MKLSVKSDYAARAVLTLARHYLSGEAQKAEELAAAQNIPVNYLVQILIELKAQKIVKSLRGKEGGYLLARPPAQISLGDVLRSVHGNVFDTPALSDPQCPPELREGWKKLQNTLDQTKTDLYEMKLEKDAEIQKLTTEKVAAENQLTFLHALPEYVVSLYSNLANIALSQPTNYQQIAFVATALSNALQSIETGRPQFELSLNGQPVTNGALFLLPKSRNVYFKAANVAGITADKLTINFGSPISLTNLVIDSRWKPGAGLWSKEGGVEKYLPWTLIHTAADDPVAVASGFTATSFNISTNVTSGQFPAYVSVFSLNSLNYRFIITLILD